MKIDLNKNLGNNDFKSEVILNKWWIHYNFDISDWNYFKYWKTLEEFRKYLLWVKLSFNDRIDNIPRCLFFDNIPKYNLNQNNIYIKLKKCNNCLFFNECKWISIFFIKIYWENILNPIMYLDLERNIDNDLITYLPFYNYSNWTGNPPKINHYRFIYKFLLNKSVDSKILEIGCFIWLFVDFILKKGFKNIIWLDSDIDSVEIWISWWNLPIFLFDVYKQSILDNFWNFDIVMMLGVLHNDYNIDDYNTSILNYSLNIINNVYISLQIGGYFIFTTHVFSIDLKILEDIWFEVEDYFMEEWSNWVYYYFLKKWR